MSPDTFIHQFIVTGDNWTVALAFATVRYMAVWNVPPALVFAHPNTPVFEAPGLVILRDERIPSGCLCFEVPSELVMGGNGR